MKSIQLLAAGCLLTGAIGLHPLSACAGETVSYVFVSDTLKDPGSQVVERGDDGLHTVKFTYRNTGRGPDFVERFRLAADGSFSEYHITGKSTFGAPVDEHFERNGAQASWRSTTEHGIATLSGPAMYVPLNSS